MFRFRKPDTIRLPSGLEPIQQGVDDTLLKPFEILIRPGIAQGGQIAGFQPRFALGQQGGINLLGEARVADSKQRIA